MGTEMQSAARRALAWMLVGVATLVLVLLAWQLRQLLILIFLALLMAAAIYQPAGWLERHRLPRVLSVIAVYLAVLLVLAGIVWLIAPPLVGELVGLAERTPQLVEQVRGWLQGLLDQLPGDVQAPGLDEATERLGSMLPNLSALAGIPLVMLNVIINLVLIVFLSALLVLERDSLRDGLLRYIAPDRRARVTEVGRTAIDKLGAYVRGQLVMMTAIGIGTGIGMFIVGVPFVLPLSFLAFLTEAIPLVGPYIAGVPIVALAFAESPLTGLLMTGWIVGLQQFEGYVLQPAIQKKALELSPVVVMLAVVAGGMLAGIVGALIAIPLVAVVQVVLQHVVLPLREQTWKR